MAMPTPQEFAAKYAERTSAASGEYTRKVSQVNEAPGAKAAQKKEKYQAGINAAIASGKWERNVAGVTLEEWKRATIEKGGARYSAGTQAAQSKMIAVGQMILPVIAEVKAEVDRMPDTTVEQRAEKAKQFAIRMHNRFAQGGRR